MMSQLVDLSARESHHDRSLTFRGGTPYALVADTDAQRIEECLAAIRPFKLETIVAREGQEAVAILERRGTPSLLNVDLSLCHRDVSKNVFALVGAIPMSDRRRVAIIVWSPRRELREFAVHRRAGF